MLKISSFLIAAALCAGGQVHAQAPAKPTATAQSVVAAYTVKAYQLYTDSLAGARKVQADLNAFVQNPTEATLANARTSWTEARKIYSQTEVYRYYGGPIDGAINGVEGPEPLINAWPLDEIYIDTIIARADLYPSLDAAALHELNEKDGEKNISTGWHAIEYMLWGQDLSATGPGARPASDFAAQNPLAARRAQYLQTLGAALVGDLEAVQVQWDSKRPGSYAQSFVKDQTALTKILTGLTKMSGAELSQERMFVALDTRSQEEEHSCFSDTTHLDIYYNYVGIKTVLTGGILDLIRAKDRSVAGEIEDNLQVTEDAINAMQVPFDQAILSDKGRAGVLAIISSLETLTESVRQGAVTIGVQLP